MVEVRVTEKAYLDISAIGDFISRDSEKYAYATIQSFFKQ